MFAKLRAVNAPNLRRNRLPVQVSVVVPSTDLDKLIPEKKFILRVKKEQKWFNDRFGGSTSINEVGTYNIGKKVIKEPGVIVESSMSVSAYEKNKKILEKHLISRRKQWKQDSLLVKVEGQAFIVPKRPFIDDDKKQTNKILVT